jgi:putative glycosyltransferase (TIGR04372 family)
MFVDYAHDERRCDALDIGLAAFAAHVVSTQTGPDAVALAFGRTVTYVDVARLRYGFFDVQSVHWQPATLIDKSDEKLSLQRQLSLGVAGFKTPDDFAREGIRVLRSGPDEYAAVAIEGIDASLGAMSLSDEDVELQNKARVLIAQGVRDGVLPNRGDATALISPRFLRSNPWWLAGDDE